MKTYIRNIFIAFSQLINSILFGYPDETLGARCYRNAFYGSMFSKVMVIILDVIFLIIAQNIDHCKKLYEEEVLDEQKHRDYDV